METAPSTNNRANEAMLAKCQNYLVSQLLPRGPSRGGAYTRTPGPAVTLSYQTGSGEHEIARDLAELLQAPEPKSEVAWTVFDRNLVERVLEEHHLPQSLASSMPEDRRAYVDDVLQELLGFRPPSWLLVPKIAETVLHLAAAGHVVLVGRGAGFITARMPRVFHVRLIAPLSTRIARVRESRGLSAEAAEQFVISNDRGRGRYIKAHFHARADNDLFYHLVINTGLVPCDEATRLIADTARHFFNHDFNRPEPAAALAKPPHPSALFSHQ